MPLAHPGDGIRMRYHPANAHARHAVCLRERAGNDHPFLFHGARYLRLVPRVGDVVVVRFVDHDHCVGLTQDPIDQRPDGTAAVQRGGGVVGVVDEHQSRAPRRVGHGGQVQRHVLEGQRLHRVAVQAGVVPGFLVRRRRRDQMLGRRGEDLGRRAQQLGGPVPDHHVIRRDVVHPGDRLDQLTDGAAGIAAGPRTAFQRVVHRRDHAGARAQRVLVVVQEQWTLLLGKRQGHGARPRTRPVVRHDGGGRSTQTAALDERPARDAVGHPVDSLVRLHASTSSKTSQARFISSIVPMLILAWVRSIGGKSRPTDTPYSRQAPRKSAAGRPSSTKMKFV